MDKTKTKTKDKPFFKSGYDLYSDKSPDDTIRVKYDTLDNLKITIRKLERLYKRGIYPHVRIIQVSNILVQRLKVIVKNFNKGKDRLKLAEKYFNFLKERSKKKTETERKKMVFKI